LSPEEEIEMRERFDEIVSDLFERMDRSLDGRVDVNEFVDQYHAEYTNTKEEIEDLKLRIAD